MSWGPRLADWSSEARHAHRAAADHRIAQEAWFELGPHLDDDGHTLVVPSPYYGGREWAAFWKARGFRWDPQYHCWERDTRRPLRGKVYGPQRWVQAAREAYARFWPRWGEALGEATGPAAVPASP